MRQPGSGLRHGLSGIVLSQESLVRFVLLQGRTALTCHHVTKHQVLVRLLARGVLDQNLLRDLYRPFILTLRPQGLRKPKQAVWYRAWYFSRSAAIQSS